VKDQRGDKNAWQDGDATNDRQLFHMLIPEHEQAGTKIPDKTDEQDRSKEIMVSFLPRKEPYKLYRLTRQN
jgi:hypothetical protein